MKQVMRTDGYIIIHKPEHPLSQKSGYIMEHRLVASNKWGIEAVRGMQVHHINGDRVDNRIENLELVTIEKHTSMHKRKSDSILREIGEENYKIECGCGCGKIIDKYDSRGRPKTYVNRHHTKLPPLKNYEIFCYCGCDNKFLKYDKHRRPRMYISGHNGRKYAYA